MPMILIDTLKLVYPLLVSPFLAPISTWRIITSRAMALGCAKAVKPFYGWLQVYMRQPAWAIMDLMIADLTDATL